ncbi:hypothetical protein NGR_b09730 (plasmid) [Sinorhizobium fredii NGR234]|uniref:Uncharacterized protein n=1 Tax=Sinorhizobium fredii (strain NBRC 101917 / NGR234) TaxID=394 RepID=C3KQR8_SINFN|nr:hypothetical protein NGR_b09730 [Sinorhizobium fredii NGR234]
MHANEAGRYAVIAVLKDHPLPHAGAAKLEDGTTAVPVLPITIRHYPHRRDD